MIAAKAGKNPRYVAARLKLTELILPAAEAFLADKLTLGHALLIAKLPPAQQDETLSAWIATASRSKSPAQRPHFSAILNSFRFQPTGACITSGVLRRGQYVEIVAKPSRDGGGKSSAEQKKCALMTRRLSSMAITAELSSIYMRGPLVHTHHAESLKAQGAQERMRTEQRKQRNGTKRTW